MDTKLLRAVGAATAVYGLAVTLRPQLLAKPSGLVDAAGRTAPDTATSLRPLAWRDAACGAAMAVAPAGGPLRAAASLRIAADFGDAALLAATLPRGYRWKAVAVSVAWGALSVAGLLRHPGAD
ncbi:hypothetical protein QNO07_25820 [Streptomyces sp. 549]|uniref:hypothetical protein n=1 Tax=Streptomyces sp. 549 TaxID=3049076 RepID=UPI0024C24D26|nr:hypothetical protein [Streptomyces sp. 549]MDK1476778.1 hypothetical protein [Streptomyces sp. 549]